MISTHEPGTVAVATVRGVPNVRVMRSSSIHGEPLWMLSGPQEVPNTEGRRKSFAHDEDVTDVRPLVTLDFAAAGLSPTVAIREIRDVFSRDSLGWPKIADQIEAQTRPPKPPEPTGLGAVVEDSDGERWLRSTTPDRDMDNLDKPWINGPVRRHWQIVDAVRVLSEGVEQP